MMTKMPVAVSISSLVAEGYFECLFVIVEEWTTFSFKSTWYDLC